MSLWLSLNGHRVKGRCVVLITNEYLAQYYSALSICNYTSIRIDYHRQSAGLLGLSYSYVKLRSLQSLLLILMINTITDALTIKITQFFVIKSLSIIVYNLAHFKYTEIYTCLPYFNFWMAAVVLFIEQKQKLRMWYGHQISFAHSKLPYRAWHYADRDVLLFSLFFRKLQ